MLLALVALLTTGMLATISVGAMRVTIGAASRLPSLVLIATVLMVGVAMGGAVFLGLRFGQGGSRLEAGAGAAPLTDGLADNRYWVLGIFYVIDLFRKIALHTELSRGLFTTYWYRD